MKPKHPESVARCICATVKCHIWLGSLWNRPGVITAKKSDIYTLKMVYGGSLNFKKVGHTWKIGKKILTVVALRHYSSMPRKECITSKPLRMCKE